MAHLTRRSFVVSAAASAAYSQEKTQPARGRDLLATAWPTERIATAIPPLDRFHPFATAAERGPWEALPSDARAALVQSGERQLRGEWASLPATVFLEYQRNGNRSRFEDIQNRRRNRLQALVIAECVEGKGRFADEIVNGVWLTCEETFWGLPAHLGAQKAGVGLPDVAEPIVELFAAETASLLAWTYYLLEPRLAAVSKLIPARIVAEIDRRLLSVCLARDFGWMGFSGQAPNNWNPWICSNWLTAAMLTDRDPKRRAAAANKIVRCLDLFLNTYADDGGCDEGPSYWGRAAASLFDCLELLYVASGGALDGFRFPLLRQMGLYICRAHVVEDWYTNFSDAPARFSPDGDTLYRFGKRVNDETMMAHGAYVAVYRNPAALPGGTIGRQLPGLFNLTELRQAARAQALVRDSWMPGIGVMTARVKDGSTEGLYLAAEAGNNGKSHNHNDVGNFVVYSGGLPAIIDVGVETYTAKTFGSKRYEIWTMQSAYHNCPTIDGVMQSAGKQFAASEVHYQTGDGAAEVRLNLAGAYPKTAGLERWIRGIRLDRAKQEVVVVDEYALAKSAGAITLSLMTPRAVTVEGPGKLSLAVAPGNVLRVEHDAVLKTSIEEIKLEDAKLRNVWGERIFRILLRAEKPPERGRWTLRLFNA